MPLVRSGGDSMLIKDPNKQKLLWYQRAVESPLINNPDVIDRAMALPTCPKCERIALRDRRPYDPPGTLYVTCPVCGYHGPGGPPAYIAIREV